MSHTDDENCPYRADTSQTWSQETGKSISNIPIEQLIVDATCDKYISHGIQKLEQAKKFLSPVIDQVIAKATSFTHSEFKLMLEKNTPICAISTTQYSYACNASDIIHEVTNQLQHKVFAEFPNITIIANPMKQYPISEFPKNAYALSDKMYVDADLMKQLIELHELINSTIGKLKNATEDAESFEKQTKKKEKEKRENLRPKLEPEFIVVDDKEFLYNTVQTKRDPNELGINSPKNSNQLDEGDQTHTKPPTKKAQKHQSAKEDNIKPEPESKPPSTDNSKNFEDELTKLKKMYAELSLAIQYLKNKSSTKSCTVLKEYWNTVAKSKSENRINTDDNVGTHLSVLKCLKELDQFKDMLCAMDHPDLTIDKTKEEPCCKLHNYPHIHALMNGIPVVIKMNKDSIDVLLAEKENELAVRTICRCGNKQKQTAQTVMDVQPEYEIYRVIESTPSLPYTVNQKSLPNVNICPPMKLTIPNLKANMRSLEISHPRHRIKVQLNAVGLDNILKASIPAKCCRIAVLNEQEKDTEPFHASLNSLPLTQSDLHLISEIAGLDNKQCMNSKVYQTQLEYYTNFQENLVSNFNYHSLKAHRVYTVCFFEVFVNKKDDKNNKHEKGERTSRTSIKTILEDLKIGDFFKRLIYNDVDVNTKIPDYKNTDKKCKSKTKISIKTRRKSKNKKCQTEARKKESIYQPSTNSLPQSIYNYGVLKDRKKLRLKKTPKPFKTFISGNLENIVKTENTLSAPTTEVFQCANQTNFASSHNNLGTIYESDEKHHSSIKTHNKISIDSISEFLKSPDITSSFQKFITSDAAMKAFEKSNLDVEQFWELYFESKKSSNSILISGKSSTLLNTKACGPIKKRRSKIPKRVFTDSSSDASINGNPKVNRLPRKIPLVSNQKKTTNVIGTYQVGVRSGFPKTSVMSKMTDTDDMPKHHHHHSNKAKIFFTEMLEETAKNNKESSSKINSLHSLQLLASKNGPGYISVLHPVCGCPEVSIFIPCYCDETTKSIKKNHLSQNTINRYRKSDGKHIILPKCCRISKGAEDGA